jgi:DNA modification methylase
MTKPYTLHRGDVLAVLRTLPDNSVDSIVTDPPYELGFMGKSWDASGIAYNVDMWREALRVLKPGGHLMAFSGSRTYHRMTCAIEDAGFEIRDQVMWVYGSGFPKSQNISKAIDKQAGAEREVVGERAGGMSVKAGGVLNFNGRDVENGVSMDSLVPITTPATPEAEQWEGWGTALKPAHEPICVARKPLAKGRTVAGNVLQFGTGALNIDACRVHSADSAGYAYTVQRMAPGADQNKTGKTHQEGVAFEGHTKDGRWPANLIHDGSPEVVALFPAEAGAQAPVHRRNGDKFRNAFGAFAGNIDEGGSTFQGDSGSAARFFYCPKATRRDRNEGLPSSDAPAVANGATMREREDADWSARNGNHHPTVKPTDLMAYLARLVTPPGGVVLDLFMGSGSTGKACMREGFQFIGIDMTPEYVEIARQRIEHELAKAEAAERAAAEKATEPQQLSLLA